MSSFVLHTFRPTETIDAVIKLLGRHNYSTEEMAELRSAFNTLNDSNVPRPGAQFKIPMLQE